MWPANVNNSSTQFNPATAASNTRRLTDHLNEHRRTLDNLNIKSNPITTAGHFLSSQTTLHKMLSSRVFIQKATDSFFFSFFFSLCSQKQLILMASIFFFVSFFLISSLSDCKFLHSRFSLLPVVFWDNRRFLNEWSNDVYHNSTLDGFLLKKFFLFLGLRLTVPLRLIRHKNKRTLFLVKQSFPIFHFQVLKS